MPIYRPPRGREEDHAENLRPVQGQGRGLLSVNSSNFCADKADAIKAFVKTNGIEYPILLDPEGKIGKLYQAKSTPHMFVIDKTGAIAYAGAIDDDPQGKAEKATNYVADAVQALLDGKPVAVKSTKPYGCSVKYKG